MHDVGLSNCPESLRSVNLILAMERRLAYLEQLCNIDVKD